MVVNIEYFTSYYLFVHLCYNRKEVRINMKITDIDLTNTIAIAQLTTVLLIIAFLLAIFVSSRTSKSRKSSP